MLLNGILPPITTPFYADGQIYFKKLQHNVERYSRTPIGGMVVLGSAGEAPMLGDEEKGNVLKAAMESAAPEKVMIACTGMESAVETLRWTEFAAGLGYDVAMVRTPYHYKQQMRPANILAFYRFVADRSPLPVVISNYPQATTYDMPAELAIELAEHANIIGISDSSGDIAKLRLMVERTRHVQRTATVTERFEPATGRMLRRAAAANASEFVPAEMLAGANAAGHGTAKPAPSSSAVRMVGNLRTRQKSVAFQVLAASVGQLHSSLQAGAVGVIVSFAAAAPTACFEIWAAFKDGDAKLADEKQQRIDAAAARIAREMGIPGLKYAMDLNGYYGGNGRLPLLPLDAATKREIEQLMINIRS